MSKSHVSLTYTEATITIAALAAVLAVALIAASPAHAACTPSGTPGGGPGNDTLCGTSGPDTLLGQDGNDQLFGSFGADTLDGGSGDDLVDGGSGNDFLRGSTGMDLFDGGPGNDQLQARDGGTDQLFQSQCGSGTDVIDIDLRDALNLGGAALFGFFVLRDCESINVGAVNEGPNVNISRRSLSVGEDGRAAVRLTCPASLAAPCAGTLRIAGSKSAGAPNAYSIDQGKRGKVSARLSRRDRRKLRQRDQITASVTSVEQGQFGDKTTVQTIKLIAQD